MMDCLLLIDQLINWFSCKNSLYIKETEGCDEHLHKTIQKVFSVCFKWLGEPIYHAIPAKLLVSLVKIGESYLHL